MLDRIRSQLARLEAGAIRVDVEYNYAPQVGPLLRAELGTASWRMLPEQFLQLLKTLPDGAGCYAVSQQLDRQAGTLWHGPSAACLEAA